MAYALSVFSYALFFLLPVLSLVGLSQCRFTTRRNLANITCLVVFGLLGVAEAVLGILAVVNALTVASAILDGFSGSTTVALLAGSIRRSNRYREKPIVPSVNLAVYCVSMGIFILCGSVLSLVPAHISSISILGPLFRLLFATAALPLLVYMFLVTISSPSSYDSPEQDVLPRTPTTPRNFQSHHLTLPLSPSFLSLSPPPSPSSHHTFSSTVFPESKTKKCASLDLPHVHSIRLDTGTETNTAYTQKKSGGRPATAPISSQEKKTRPRPAPLNLSLQVGVGTGSPHAVSFRASVSMQNSPSNQGQHSPRISKKPRLRHIISKGLAGVGGFPSMAHRVWAFLLVAQIAALLSQVLRICKEVALSQTASAQEPGILVLESLANLFFVMQSGNVMGALISYRQLLSPAADLEDKPTPKSIKPSRIPFPTSSTNLAHHSPDPSMTLRASAMRTDSLPSMAFPTNLEVNHEQEDFDQLDRDLRALSDTLDLEMSRQTDLEALDLALPLTPKSDSSLERITPPLKLSIQIKQVPATTRIVSSPSTDSRNHIATRSASASVHDEIRHELDSFPFSIAKVAEALETDRSKSTVVFPTDTSVPINEVQVRDAEEQESPMRKSISGDPSQSQQSSPSRSRSSAQSFGSKGVRNTKHSRLPSIPSFSSFSSSIAKSRLRSISLTGKSTGRSLSMATVSERNSKKESTVSLSRSSSFCSPRPQRKALPDKEVDVRCGQDTIATDDLDEGEDQEIVKVEKADVFSSEYCIPRSRRPDALFSDKRNRSPLPFASYISESAPPKAQNQPYSVSRNEDINNEEPSPRPPLRPSRSSTFHIFPNFDALADLGSLGAKLSRGLSRSPTPTRVLSLGAGGGVVGMRSPTPRRMTGITETVTGGPGTVRSPSRLGMKLFRMGRHDQREQEEEEPGNESSGDEDFVKAKGRGWKRVDLEEKNLPYTSNIELSELRTPKRSDRLRVTPMSLDTSDTETTPTSVDLQTPRTPFTPSTPISSLRKLTRSPQPSSDPPNFSPSRSSFPLSSGQFEYKSASPPPSAFTGSRFASKKSRMGWPVEVFDDDNSDPFAGPGLGAIVRESQISLLGEDQSRFGEVQTATRMSAWGNLALPVPKEKRNPGVGLRRTVSDSRKTTVPTRSNCPESPLAYSQETGTESHLPSGNDIAAEIAVVSKHDRDGVKGSRGSIYLPVEEALLAQKLLRRLDRREAEGQNPTNGRQKRSGSTPDEVGRSGAAVQPESVSTSGGRSFLLSMARGKFLGYGWSS